MAHADVRSRLLEQGAPASHLERLAALISLAELDDGCRAIALVGSYAKGSGDRISDLDLVMFVRNDKGEGLLAESHKILERQPILSATVPAEG